MILYKSLYGVFIGHLAKGSCICQIRYACGVGCQPASSPLLEVMERHTFEEVSSQGGIQTIMTLLDAAQIAPEQFELLIKICPTILNVDPDTYQLTVLSSPHQANAIAELARVIGILSIAIQPA